MTYQNADPTKPITNCKIHGLIRTKHLRCSKDNGLEFNKLCAAIADEPEIMVGFGVAHAALFAGCADDSEAFSTENKRLALVDAENEKNKECPNHKTSHQ